VKNRAKAIEKEDICKTGRKNEGVGKQAITRFLLHKIKRKLHNT